MSMWNHVTAGGKVLTRNGTEVDVVGVHEIFGRRYIICWHPISGVFTADVNGKVGIYPENPYDLIKGNDDEVPERL
jgi:hypothetical protein